MWLKEKFNVRDKHHRHTVRVFEEDGRELGIDQDHNIADSEQFYIFEAGKAHGEGCETVWYPSLEAAKLEVARLFNTGKKRKTGQDAGLCERCQNHYFYNSAGWKRYPAFACLDFKRGHVAGVAAALAIAILGAGLAEAVVEIPPFTVEEKKLFIRKLEHLRSITETRMEKVEA